MKNTYFFAFSAKKNAADAGYERDRQILYALKACKNCFLPEKSKEIFCKGILY